MAKKKHLARDHQPISTSAAMALMGSDWVRSREMEARKKIVRAAKANMLRKRVASRIARREEEMRRQEEQDLRTRLAIAQQREKAACRKITRLLRTAIKKRKSQQRKAAAEIQRFYRAREAFRDVVSAVSPSPRQFQQFQ